MKKKAAEKISTAFASPASLLDATLKRLIQPGLSFCRPDKTRQASHQAQMSNAYNYSEIQVPASPASVSSIRDNAPIHAGLPRLLT